MFRALCFKHDVSVIISVPYTLLHEVGHELYNLLSLFVFLSLSPVRLKSALVCVPDFPFPVHNFSSWNACSSVALLSISADRSLTEAVVVVLDVFICPVAV